MDFAGAFQWVNIRFLLDGLLLTLQVAVISVILSVIFGVLLGVLRYWKIPVFSKVLGWIIDIIRNLPLLLIIFFTYFALPQMGIHLNIFWAAVTALTVFESAMISEIIRGGLESIPAGQAEAGLATGMTNMQIMRYIMMPQVFRDTLPSIVSQLIALIKDTSLATIITLPELTHHAKIIYSLNTEYVVPMFIALAVLYFIVCYALSLFSKQLARRMAVNK